MTQMRTAASFMRAKKYAGGCLCGATRFSFVGKLDNLYFCHCSQCRKNYGLYGAFAGVIRSALVTEKADKLQSFKSSRNTTRTFCGVCCSPVTWDREGDEHVYVLMGTLDGDIQTTGAKHIYLNERGGYYEICGSMNAGQDF
jgi:hypothetical protein